MVQPTLFSYSMIRFFPPLSEKLSKRTIRGEEREERGNGREKEKERGERWDGDGEGVGKGGWDEEEWRYRKGDSMANAQISLLRYYYYYFHGEPSLTVAIPQLIISYRTVRYVRYDILIEDGVCLYSQRCFSL